MIYLLQLFGLEETAEEAEVLFASHFQSAVSKVLSHDTKVQQSSQMDTSAGQLL